MIERLDMDDKYSEIEIAIHLNRYYLSKNYCKHKNVLDIACGEGYGSYLISTWGAKKVVGIDISNEAIEKAKSNFESNNLEYLCQDATNLELLKDDSFDLVVSYETFEHVPSVEKYLKEIRRVAKKDAVIIISCPNDYYYYPTDDKSNPFHMRKYKFEDFIDIAEKYLGKNVKYMVGSEIMGFINTFIGSKDPKHMQLKEIASSFYDISCQKIHKEEKVNPELCNYYVGIWNADTIEESCCVFPHMYTDWKYFLDKANDENNNLKSIINDKDNLIKEIERNNDKISLANGIVSYQKDEIRDYAKYLTEELIKVNVEKNQLLKDNKKLEAEIMDLKDKNSTLKWQNDFITNSRSYKITRKIVKLVKRK